LNVSHIKLLSRQDRVRTGKAQRLAQIFTGWGN